MNIIDSNEAFYDKTEKSLRSLFDISKNKNELQYALALSPESRGEQAPGWNTAQDANVAFKEYMDFIESSKGPIRFRVAVAFYCHLSEASGFYEIPKNMLRIAGGDTYKLWPFSHLVDKHRDTGARIAPNANKILKDLIGHSTFLGLTELAEVFRDAFDADIRNGFAHADYIIWNDGLRLRKRNGGAPRIIPWEEFSLIFDRGVNLFHILRSIVSESVESYKIPKSFLASLSGEPEQMFTISCEEAGSLEISCK